MTAVKRREAVRGAAGRLAGLTLLELLIILAVIGVLIFIALPTLRPTDVESSTDFAKQQLMYLHGLEERYFSIHGTYAPFSKIASDERLGPSFDQRFATNDCVVNDVTFSGPASESGSYVIIATLPDGTQYKVDPTGSVMPNGSVTPPQ
jgi:Tfp pilus assembly protein PilE